MRSWTFGPVVGLAAVMAFSAGAAAQQTVPAPAAQQGRQGVDQRPPSVYQKLGSDTGGPAPKRELTGVWAGPFGERVGPPMVIPPLTPLGESLRKLNVPDTGSVTVADTNDPWKRYCDPLGFPRAILEEQRAYAFAPMADRVVELIQYEHVWREIYTDGRELPKNVGAKGGPDPRYYGYSVGHWADDNTFVVETTGLDDRTWIGNGYPHSMDMHVTETYKRADHNDLQLSVVMDDPKIFTKPFTFSTAYKWIPAQTWEEQLCIPSDIAQYQQIISSPAAGKPAQK
jgi:hypothetical protein